MFNSCYVLAGITDSDYRFPEQFTIDRYLDHKLNSEISLLFPLMSL